LEFYCKWSSNRSFPFLAKQMSSKYVQEILLYPMVISRYVMFVYITRKSKQQ
jgi:hypothetical protein